MASSVLYNFLVGENGSVAMQASNNKMEYVHSWWLMSSPVIPAIILASYLIFVLKIGPSYMKDRKPFHFPNLMTFYNISQVIFSVYLMYATGRMLFYNGLIPKTCCLDTEFNKRGIALGMYYYLVAKVIELLDTVFFVLRKKNQQVSFLHVYHHTTMVIVTWSALKYEPTIHLLFLGVMNSFVHVLMYTYYGLSAFPSFTKYLWWKKYLTSLQLAQFVMVYTIFVIAYITSECTPSYVLLGVLTWNESLFLYLFGKFYFKNYTKKHSTTVNDNGKKENIVNGIQNNNIDFGCCALTQTKVLKQG